MLLPKCTVAVDATQTILHFFVHTTRVNSFIICVSFIFKVWVHYTVALARKATIFLTKNVYWALDGSGFEPWWGQDFPHPYRLTHPGSCTICTMLITYVGLYTQTKVFQEGCVHKNTSGSVPLPPWDSQIFIGITITSSKNLEIHFLFLSFFLSFFRQQISDLIQKVPILSIHATCCQTVWFSLHYSEASLTSNTLVIMKILLKWHRETNSFSCLTLWVWLAEQQPVCQEGLCSMKELHKWSPSRSGWEGKSDISLCSGVGYKIKWWT
jgi:hypothetical protein